jgi:hypothetical protein
VKLIGSYQFVAGARTFTLEVVVLTPAGGTAVASVRSRAGRGEPRPGLPSQLDAVASEWLGRRLREAAAVIRSAERERDGAFMPDTTEGRTEPDPKTP